MSVYPGTRLGPYEIIDLVGAGGMGEVYKATDTRLGRTVAVKVLGSRFSKRFEGEACAIAALNHPHICTLFDVGPDYLVMEYVEGAPLNGPLPVEEALRLAIQIASALEVAHGKGIIHRDLKPGNILVTKAGVKLLDFGLAKLTQNEDGDVTRTIEGAVMGTAAYMSPEQAEGKPVDARSDIFSFGADGFHLWSERYDRDLADVFAVQDEIAGAICGALQLKLSRQPASGREHRPTLPAYEANLKGFHYAFKLTPASLTRAQEYHEQAISLDSLYGMPHYGLGHVYFLLAYHGLRPAHEVMPLVRAEAQKALELDPSLPEAHGLLGVVAAAYEYDWQEAARQFRLALTSIPVPSVVHFHHACMYLLPLGRVRESADEVEPALEQDPLNVLYRIQLALSFYAAEMPERAIAEVRKALEVDDNHWTAHAVMGRHYISSGMMVEALASVQRAYQLAPWNPSVIGLLAATLVRAGDRKRAEGFVQQLMELPPHGIPMGMALYHLMCSEMDSAADWIEKAIEQRAPSLLILLRHPLLKPLRSSPRWPGLMRMMNLPETA